MNYSKGFAARINTRGPKEGNCNICGAFGALTEDHTPPKGIPGCGQVDLYRIAEAIGTEIGAGGRRFQRGVTYRSLCRLCNTDRLGGRFDPSLISFAKSIDGVLKSPIALPRILPVTIFPSRVVRSVVGHILAARVGTPAEGTAGEAMKAFFLDDDAPFPSSMACYTWVYAGANQVTIRMSARMTLRGHDWLFSLMKFYPLAFMLVWDAPPGSRFPLASLTALSQGIDAQDEVRLDLRSNPPLDWPETPSNDSGVAVLHGDDAVVAIPRK